ncbi:MAG: MerR family transcriptional regulator [Pseudomonadota bacterium]|nr:MerR family transcriptional regulator [Pseudomonadota bacterium]
MHVQGPQKKLKKIGEVAQMLGTTPRTLRFYEEENLVVSRRTKGGTRLYADEDIARLRIILKLTELDIPINVIKNLALARPKSTTGAQASHTVSEVLESMLKVISQRRQLYELVERELQYALSIVAYCHHCHSLPTRQNCSLCPINLKHDNSDIFHLIWQQDLNE